MSVELERMSVPFVDLGLQYASIAGELEEAALRAMRESGYILGRDVAAFEGAFAAYCGAPHAIGTDTGLAALELALRAFAIGPGDEVITAANTFIATALAISAVGATPVLVDVDPRTYTLDPAALGPAITPRTRAVIPVHLYGQPADMDPIMAIAARHGLLVIEDACQAHGARYRGRRAGSIGHAAAFSFYPAKNLGAYGDGGMVVTRDAQAADRVRLLRNYGQREKYNHLVRGYNHRLDTMQAAMLQVKLPHLDSWNAARRRHALQYGELLAGGGLELPAEADGVESVWHLYVVHADEREALRGSLAEAGVVTGLHYPLPVHLQPAYSDLGYGPGDFPVSERSARRLLSLPMYPELKPEQVAYVAAVVGGFFGQAQPAGLAARAVGGH